MKRDIIIEWLATSLFLISVLLTSFNVYPMNVYVALLANILWLWLGVIWQKWSLIIVEAVVVIIYLIGTIKSL